MANALCLFFRSLAGQIADTAHIIAAKCDDMTETDKMDWPVNKTIKIIDQAGATWVVDSALLLGWNSNLYEFLSQLTYNFKCYKNYAEAVPKFLEDLIFEKSDFLFKDSWDEIVHGHLSRRTA